MPIRINENQEQEGGASINARTETQSNAGGDMDGNLDQMDTNAQMTENNDLNGIIFTSEGLEYDSTLEMGVQEGGGTDSVGNASNEFALSVGTETQNSGESGVEEFSGVASTSTGLIEDITTEAEEEEETSNLPRQIGDFVAEALEAAYNSIKPEGMADFNTIFIQFLNQLLSTINVQEVSLESFPQLESLTPESEFIELPEEDEIEHVVEPAEGTKAREYYDVAMQVPEFAREIEALRASPHVFSFQMIDGDKGYIEQQEYVERPVSEGGSYQKFVICFGEANPEALNGLGRSKLHPLFEEVFHAADYAAQRSSSATVEVEGKILLGDAKEDLEHEARAWNFAANYAPTAPNEINANITIDKDKVVNVRITNPLIQRIKALNSDPIAPNPQISKWLYEGFDAHLIISDNEGNLLNETDKNFPAIYTK